MSKYRPLYRCMICNSLMQLDSAPAVEISDERIAAVVQAAADPMLKNRKVRKLWPNVTSHNCSPGGGWGAAVFAGVRPVLGKN